MSNTNELDVWENGVPVVNITADPDFEVWQNDAPVVDAEGGVIITPIRRRVVIF